MRRVTLRERGRLHSLREGAVPELDGPDHCWIDARLFERLQDYDSTRKDGAAFDWRRSEAQAGQWVGVMQVPGLVVELLPKIDAPEAADAPDPLALARDNLLVMLGESGDVPIRTRDLAALATRAAPLHETLITLFARRMLAELLRGPHRAYVEETDDLRSLRGKLVLSRHIARNAARRDRFTCAYQEFSVDTPLGRVLRATCRALLLQTRGAPAREALSHCLLALEDVSDVPDPMPWLDRVVLTRQNERFADVLVFCRLVLEQLAPSAKAGRATTFSLLFDMDRVFEGFVAGFLRRRVLPELPDARLYPQARTRTRYLLQSDQGHGALQLKPDLLLETPTTRVVLDTKWKRLGSLTQRRQAGLAAADLYQLYAYTRRFDVKRSVLLFPHMPGAASREFEILSPQGESEGTRICVRFVNLHRNLRRATERDALGTELRDLLQEVLGAA